MRAQPLPSVPNDRALRVLIACDHASAGYGGEAILPLHHFRLLRDNGFGAWLVAHSRSRAELAALFPGEDRIHYVEESALDRWMWRIGRHLPPSVDHLTTGFVARLSVQFAQRRQVRRLVAEHAIDVVHQPTPVSPREPSLLYRVGAPVIIGPMNGGMDYPPAFRTRRGVLETRMRQAGRWLTPLLNRLMPGKREAALLLVANERTRAALPKKLQARAEVLVENGVELDLWTAAAARPHDRPEAERVTTFAFVGRLIELKAVDLLLEALARARRHRPMRLLVIGDGQERAALERQAARLFPDDAGGPVVRFTGALSQNRCAELLGRADALVLPSLHDCGGAVVLEAMAMALPVIATAWGGPLDYLDESCGILVEPAGPEALVEGLAAALLRLAESPETRTALGRAARERARREYDWNAVGRRMFAHYRQVAGRRVPSARVEGSQDAPGRGAETQRQTLALNAFAVSTWFDSFGPTLG